jgi:hypothetical protein
MLSLINKKLLRAQSLSEYAMLITLIALVFTVMQLFTKRAIQGVVKYSTDQIGFQRHAAEEQDVLKGHLLSAKTQVINDTGPLTGPNGEPYTFWVTEDPEEGTIKYRYNEKQTMYNYPGYEWNVSNYIVGIEEKNE